MEMYRAGLDFYRKIGAYQQLAARLSNMSIIEQIRGNLDAAIDLQNESLEVGQETKHEEGQAISLHQLAMLYRGKEEYETALARSQAAEGIDRKRGDQVGLAADLHEQGIIYNEMARVAESDEERWGYGETAVSRFHDSIAIKRRIGNDAGAATTLSELGKLLRDAGQMNEAINAFNEALATFRKEGDPVKAAISIEHLGSVHERQGQYAAALAKYQEALALAQQYWSPQNIAIVQNDIARVQAKLGGG